MRIPEPDSGKRRGAWQGLTLAAAPLTQPVPNPLSARDVMRMATWGVLLVIILVTAMAAIRRFTRRYRAYLLRKRTPPTASDDVWKMHRLPSDDEENEETGRVP